MKIYRVGLKTNSEFLFSAMNRVGVSGLTGGINHRSIIYLNKAQFYFLKKLIIKFGYNANRSLRKIDAENYDYSCYLIRDSRKRKTHSQYRRNRIKW